MFKMAEAVGKKKNVRLSRLVSSMFSRMPKSKADALETRMDSLVTPGAVPVTAIHPWAALVDRGRFTACNFIGFNFDIFDI